MLVMATGKGKTFTAFQIVWKLLKSKKVRRVLYLADRNVLIDQTTQNDFKPLEKVLCKVKSSHADVLDSEVLLRVLLVAEEITDTVEAYPSYNFTSLGGNSLLAMKFSTLLRSQGIKISTPQILKLNELQKIADNAQVDYSKLWSSEQYQTIVKDFADKGEK